MPQTFYITLDSKTTQDEIQNLKDRINEQNIKGILAKITYVDIKDQSLSGAELSPLITVILGSTVVASGVKGLFEVFKNYISLRDAKDKREKDFEIEVLRSKEMVLRYEDESGKKIEFKLNSGNDEERSKFTDMTTSLVK